MIRIFTDNAQDKINVGRDLDELIKNVAEGVLKYEDIDEKCEVNVMFADNDLIRNINHEQRNIDSATDVLSFPFLNAKNGEITVFDEDFYEGYLTLGDIVISLERAAEQAKEYGHSFEREVGFLTCHSMLHLLGYDHIDESDRAIMRRKEEEILKILKLTRD